jgi:hypothetical protein
MSSKPYILIASLMLVACSGSTAGIDMLASEQPTTYVTVEPDSSPSPVEESDAGTDADVVEAKVDADLSDSGSDAAVDADAEDPTPRFGVSFHGGNAEAVAAPMPSDIAGQTSLTLEAWYRLDASSDRGTIMATPRAYCAVTTGGPATIHCCANASPGGLQACVVSPVVAGQGVWYHVAWVLSSETWTLFVNGAKQGDAVSPFQAHPNVLSVGVPTEASHLFLGASAIDREYASISTIDEFRLTYSALYTKSFTPPKHLNAPGRLNLLLDDGMGTTSGPATLYGGASWVSVNR